MKVVRILFHVQYSDLRFVCQVIYLMVQNHMIQRIPLGVAGKIHQEAQDLH